LEGVATSISDQPDSNIESLATQDYFNGKAFRFET